MHNINNYWIRLPYEVKNNADLGACSPPKILLDLHNFTQYSTSFNN